MDRRMLKRRWLATGVAILGSLLVSTACSSGHSPTSSVFSSNATRRIPVTEIVVGNRPLHIPDVRSGLRTLRFAGSDGADHTAFPMKFHPGVSVEQLSGSLTSDDIPAALSMVEGFGGSFLGPGADPNASPIVTVDLSPGAYVLLDVSEKRAPTAEPFRVIATKGAAPEQPESMVSSSSRSTRWVCPPVSVPVYRRLPTPVTRTICSTSPEATLATRPMRCTRR